MDEASVVVEGDDDDTKTYSYACEGINLVYPKIFEGESSLNSDLRRPVKVKPRKKAQAKPKSKPSAHLCRVENCMQHIAASNNYSHEFKRKVLSPEAQAGAFWNLQNIYEKSLDEELRWTIILLCTEEALSLIHI